MIDPRSMLLALGALLLTSPAFALDAETADLVNGYTIDLPRSFAIDEDDGTVFVGADECESMLADARVSVNFATSFSPATNADLIEELDIFTVERDSTARIDCLSGELCSLIDRDDYDYTASGVSVDVAFADMLAVGDFTECSGFDQEFFIRLIVEQSTTDSSGTENADAKIVVDTVAPAAPSGVNASATENTLKVSFTASADDDINRYFVYWSTSPFDGGVDPDALTLERKSIGEEPEGDVSVSLNPAEPLYVAVVAEDEAGNLSNLSGVVEATVTETNDFWEEYKGAGGEETGGCSSAPGSSPSPWFLILGLMALGLRRRRRATPLAAAALLVSLLTLAPTNASAETKTWGAFELKLAGYYPAIDDEFGGEGPFASVFGTKSLLLGELEVDGWLWQRFGKLGIAGHIGYSRVKGGAVSTDETAGEDAEIEDTTAFTVIPLRMSLVYRFDWLAQNTSIPLSFGVKAGPSFYRWRITNSNGETATVGNDTGAGWTNGWHAAFGLQLLLDFIDKGTAAAFDLSWGVNNSYLFAEFMLTRIDDFGGDGFDLSDNLLMFGLSFEF